MQLILFASLNRFMLEGHPKGPNLKSSHLILPNPTNPLHMSYHSYQVPVTGLRYHWVLFHDDFLILPTPVFHDHVPILPSVYLATVSKGGVFEFLKNLRIFFICLFSNPTTNSPLRSWPVEAKFVPQRNYFHSFRCTYLYPLPETLKIIVMA